MGRPNQFGIHPLLAKTNEVHLNFCLENCWVERVKKHLLKEFESLSMGG
jgi:hypothetical protein